MHHLSRALATARIEDLRREAAQMRTIGVARRITHEPHVVAASRVLILSAWRWTGRRHGRSRRDRAPMPREMRSERW
jgi:hypothetical protein